MSAEARTSTQNEGSTGAPMARLEADGFIVRNGDGWKTSRRWQQAMARAAVKLYDQGDPGDDLRVPIVVAMLDAYRGELDDENLVELVEAMLPIETASLGLGPR
jgi:hypothetical protein